MLGDVQYLMTVAYLQVIQNFRKKKKTTDILQKREMLGAYLCVVIIYQSQR